MANVTVGLGPAAVAYDAGDGEVYVPNSEDGNVSVISGTAVVGSVTTGGTPNADAYDGGSGDIYVTGQDPSALSEISGTSEKGMVGVGTDPVDLTYDSGNGDLYVVNSGSDNVSVVDGTTVVGTVSVGTGPSALVYDGGDGYVYVVNPSSHSVSVVSGTALLTTISLGGPAVPTCIAYDSGNGEVYVANAYADNVTVISGTQTVGKVNVGSESDSIVYDSADGDVYVANGGSNNVSVISGTRLAGTIALGSTPEQLAYDTGLGTVEVTMEGNGPSGLVGEIDGASLLGSVSLGSAQPVDIAYDSSNGDVYTVDNGCGPACGQGVVSVISPAAPSAATLTGVSISPTSASVGVSSTTGAFTATPTCSTTCPATGLSYSWTASHPSWGTLNTPTAASTTFTSGSTPGTLDLYVNASLNGTTLQSAPAKVTITASSSPYKVYFYVSPARCGDINFSGFFFGNDTSANFPSPTTDAITAPACAGDTFHQWNTTGGVTVNSSSSNPTTATTSANGTLTAWYILNGTVGETPSYTVNFLSEPSSCPVDFNGTTYATNASATFLAGNYTASAPDCPGYAFAEFHLAHHLVVITSTTTPSVFDLVGNSSLTTIYNAVPASSYTVTFDIDRAACGPLTFNGTSQANQSSVQVLPGTYTVSAPTCSGETFEGFTWAFGLSSGGSTANLDTVDVTGNGTITGTYWTSTSPPPRAHYIVTFDVSPSSCGPITFNGTAQANQTSVKVLAGTFTATAPACLGYIFAVWSATPAFTLSGTLTPSSSVTVGGNGTLDARYQKIGPVPIFASLNANRTEFYAGGSVNLSSSVSGGVAPFGYTWLWNGTIDTAPPANSTLVSSLIVGLGRPGNYTFQVWVTDARGVVVESNIVRIEVLPLPTTPPQSQGPAPSPGFSLLGLSTSTSYLLIALLAVAVVAILAAVVLLRRRKDPPASAPTTSPPPHVANPPPDPGREPPL